MSMELSPRLPSRRKAEEFARLLEGGGSTQDPALAPLVGLARSLETLPLGPAPEFRDALRQRLLAVAAVAPHQQPAAPQPAGALASLDRLVGGWRAQRRVSLAAGAMAGVVALTGVAVAGNRSLPGDPLYGLKKGTESLQLATTHGLQARGELHLRFARERLTEVERLSGAVESLGAVQAGSVAPLAPVPEFGGTLSSKLVSTLERMDDETLAGGRDLTKVFTQTKDTAALELLVTFSARQQERLNAVLPSLPDAARSAAVVSLGVLSEVRATTNDLLSGGQCTDACRPTPAPTPTAGSQPVPPAEPTPCTCSPSRPGTGSDPEPSTEPSSDPTPSSSPEPSPSESPKPSPSPSPSSLVDQVGQIIKDLPTPPPTPIPLPTIPAGLPSALPTISLP